MATRLRLPAFGTALPWGLAALSLLLAFGQRHGRAYVDTRIELTTDPGLFLDRVTSVWSPTLDFGHVQSGQFVGYLFPMGPYFAGTDALGVPAWVAERIWLASLLWLAGWGTVLLVDALYGRRRGSVHLVAAILYLANPYVVVQANRATASLLAYAALPWILLAAHRGLREPRAWRWPAVVALAVAASSGGTNAATVFWIAVAPGALLLYEVLVIRERRADALAFAWRAALLAALASAWWIVPALIQGKQGADFLAFTEQPRSIWSTSSMSESLRLMGYWLSYFQTGFGTVQPASTAVRPYLVDAPVIVATFAVPLLAFGGLLLTRRRWPYAPFFGLLAVGALLVMAAGYPAGKPAAITLESIYYKLQATQFLRTTYKAGPLLALSLACLAGAAARELMALVPPPPGRRAVFLRVAPAATFAAVAVLFAYPFFTGRMIEPAFTYGAVPGVWHSAIADAARTTPEDRRIMVLPGQLFGAYRWGQTFTPIVPALTRHRVLQRDVVHYADPRAVQLQQTVDDLVQQGRLVPGQLRPLLEHMGVGQVVVAADGLAAQTGESPPATIAESLHDQPGFERAAEAYGSTRRYVPLRGHGGPGVALPDLRRYPTPGGHGAGVVRLNATEKSVVLDGDGNGIAELAATTGLSPSQALLFAGDLDRDAIRDEVRSGATLVFSDSNRRRRLMPTVIRGDVGPTLAAGEAIARDVPWFDLFPKRGSRAQTVADYGGLASLHAPTALRETLTPGRPPYAAFDGQIETTWVPPEPLPSCPCLDLALRRPRSVPYIRVHPRTFGTGGTIPLGVAVNGGPERTINLSPLGWNRIAIGARRLKTLRLRTSRRPLVGTLGLDEVEIPGVRVRESLRMPTWLATATRGLDLRRNSVAVELQRTTDDFPFRPSAGTLQVDREIGISRLVTLPVRRRFDRISGWAAASRDAPDPAFDRLAGMPGRWVLDGSGRFEGAPGRRASSAFDGDPATSWVADYDVRRPSWLSVTSPSTFTVRQLRLVRGPTEYRSPARLDIEAGGEAFRDLRPRADGTVELPRAVRTRSMRVDVTDVNAPAAAGARRLLDAVAIGEVEIPGLRPPAPRRHGRFRTSCGDLVLRSGPSSVTAEVSGSLEALNRGAPLPVAECGTRRALELPAGTHLVTAVGTMMRPYLISLRSPGAPGSSVPPPPPGSVVSQGTGGDGSRDDVRLRLDRPAWLVLAEGYAPGWRAACRSADGKERKLGAPEPIDGFANGWRVAGSCAKARFWFAPQRLATISYLISALAGLAILLVLIVLPLLPRRGSGHVAREVPANPDVAIADPVLRLAWGPAAAIGIAAGLLGAWYFAIRAGILLAVALVFLIWLGVNSRRLLWLGIAPLAAIPVFYVLHPDSERDNGFFGFADAHLAEHWLAAAAVCAVGAACLLDAGRRRRATIAETSESTSHPEGVQPRDPVGSEGTLHR